MERQKEIELIAGAIADGDDWRREQIADPDRPLLKHLETIQRIAQIHTALHHGGSNLQQDESRTWGPLQLRERLGQGSFGEVYRAWDPRIEREVALKLLYADLEAERSALPSVIEEGRLLARVRHPNVVAIYGAQRHDGRTGLWMEYIQGRTLEHLLREQGPLSAREATSIGVELCHALAAVHEAGLIHRDVKAQNVMRESGGRVVLMDFGAGVEAGPKTVGSPQSIGTPLYVAPEVLRGATPTVRSDIYSLGVLLYYIVTGSYPVEGANVAEVRDAHASQLRRRLRDRRPDLPGRFVSAIERAIAKDPVDRFSSAGDLEVDLIASLRDRRRIGEAPARARALGQPTAVLAVLLVAAALVFSAREWRAGNVEPTSAVRQDDPEAVELTARGRIQLSKRTPDALREARALFEAAIERDPLHGPAHAALADTYAVSAIYGVLESQDAMPRAKAAALRAIALDPALADPYVALGYVAWLHEWNWGEADRQFRAALERDPNYAVAHHVYAVYLKSMGRFDEALVAIERAKALDPLSPIITADHVTVLSGAGHFEEAIAAAERVLAIDSRSPEAHHQLAWAYAWTGRHDRAIATFERWGQITSRPGDVEWLRAKVLALAGRREEALRIVERLNPSPNSEADIGHAGAVYSLLGDREEAFRWLERAYALRAQHLIGIKADPVFFRIRDDPRFAEFLRRLAFEPDQP